MIDRRIQRAKNGEIVQSEELLFSGHYIQSEKGVVLVVVMVLSAIALSLVTAMLYMITTGTQASGLQKRYKTALEAGIGGGNVFCQLISARGDATLIGSANLNNFVISTPAICTGSTGSGLNAKLLSPSTSWHATNCDKSLSITPTVASSYDMRVDLGTYRVYAKIVATTTGNTVVQTGNITGSVASSNTGLVAVTPISYLYGVEVVSENIANADERSKISVLYQF
jgi:hypothetical protein